MATSSSPGLPGHLTRLRSRRNPPASPGLTNAWWARTIYNVYSLARRGGERGRPLSIKHASLGLPADGPLDGYGLKAAYEAELVPGAALNIGQVYPALDKLQADGLVTVDVVPQEDRPDRKVYTLTEAG